MNMQCCIRTERNLGKRDPILGHFIEHFHRQIYGGVLDPKVPLSIRTACARMYWRQCGKSGCPCYCEGGAFSEEKPPPSRCCKNVLGKILGERPLL